MMKQLDEEKSRHLSLNCKQIHLSLSRKKKEKKNVNKYINQINGSEVRLESSMMDL